jgi:23S rRNA U2552 (ribose-2'-O)-methylase RlmE/FtsJ
MSYFTLPIETTNDFFYKNLKLSETLQKKRKISVGLSQIIAKSKMEIEKDLKQWEIMKKYTNPYEFIHTNVPGTKAALCNYRPISRSYYKMIEILKLTYIFDNMKFEDNRLTSFHLAEGPGGFIEAFATLRKNTSDTYYGMTLINNNFYVPGWEKINKFLEQHKNIIIETGHDGTGNLLHKCNLEYCYANYNNKMDIITADGGIDYSINYNAQEDLSLRLIFAQVAFAVAMQKQGGCLILKVFDIFAAASVDIIYLLSNMYNSVVVVKPNTSRYANSEKFIICKDFKATHIDLYMEYIYKIYDELAANDLQSKEINRDYYIHRFLSCPIPLIFIYKLEEINTYLGTQQLETINATFNLINKPINCEKMKIIVKNNVDKCIRWCIKYGQSYSRKYSQTNMFL